MANMSSLVSSLPKFGHAGAGIARSRAWNPRIFAAGTPRPIQVPPSSNEEGSSLSSDGIKGTSETVNVACDQNKDKAYSTAPREATQKAKEVGREMTAKAENIGERAKQAMQDAWDSTKNTAQRATDTVLGKAQESADTLKQNLNDVNNKVNNNNNNNDSN